MTPKLRFVVLILLVVVGIASISGKPASAKEYWYYTDATKTEMCGYRFELCSGARWGGCETAWYDVYDLGSCSTGGGGGGGSSPWVCRNGIDDDGDGWVDECIYGDESYFNP